MACGSLEARLPAKLALQTAAARAEDAANEMGFWAAGISWGIWGLEEEWERRDS